MIRSTLLLFALGLSSCYIGELPSCQSYLQSRGNGGLPYETIEHGGGNLLPDKREKWQGGQIELRVIPTPDEIEEIALHVSDNAKETLDRLDYTSEFAVIAFVGPETGGTTLCLTEIVRQANAISVYSLMVNVGHGPAVEQFPYHLIRVQKEGTWDDIFTFDLVLTEHTRNYSDSNPFKYPIKMDVGVVTSVSQFIP